MYLPAARASLVRADPARTGLLLGRFAGTETGGFIFGPVLGTAIFQVLGLQAPFLLVTAVLAVVLVVLARVEIPGTRTRSRRRPPRGARTTGPAGRSVPPPAPPRRRGGRALPTRHLPPRRHLRRPLGPLPHGPGRLDTADRVGAQPLRGALRARRPLGRTDGRPPRTGPVHDHRDARRRADHRHLRPPRGASRHHRIGPGRGHRDGVRRAGSPDGHGPRLPSRPVDRRPGPLRCGQHARAPVPQLRPPHRSTKRSARNGCSAVRLR